MARTAGSLLLGHVITLN